jgi:hypothetical protein
MRGGSWQKLEALWERNRTARKKGKVYGLGRPKSLRGPALVNYVMQLSRIYRDKRFGDFINALFEHGIVNVESHVFIDTQGPELDSYAQRQESELLSEVCSRTERGVSERQACAEVAAEWGLLANSFAAAIEQLKYLRSRSSGK